MTDYDSIWRMQDEIRTMVVGSLWNPKHQHTNKESDMEYKELNNGLKMPMIGLGVYNISERETQRVVENAISVGYRSRVFNLMYPTYG